MERNLFFKRRENLNSQPLNIANAQSVKTFCCRSSKPFFFLSVTFNNVSLKVCSVSYVFFFGSFNVQAIITLFSIYLSKILNVKVKKFSKTQAPLGDKPLSGMGHPVRAEFYSINFTLVMGMMRKQETFTINLNP